MPIRPEREYRKAQLFETRTADEEEKSYIVEGYASTFNDPYVLMRFNGIDYREQIDAHAFDNADMSDVIMQYDHEGKVYARQKNGTLELSIDEHGLKVRADLSKSAASRELYEEIKAGLISEMSFAFTIDEDAYNESEHLRTVTKIRKVYDVSAVSIPANPSTDISARAFVDGVIEKEKQELLERQKKAEAREAQKRRISILLECNREV